jgi:septum formation protein
MPNPNSTFILASGSPRRQHLLSEAGFTFSIIVPEVNEWEDRDADPADLVLHNARLKAAAVSSANPQNLVLASDTTVALEKVVLNKPADLDEARRMLRQLSGRTHTVFTACVLQRSDPALHEEFVERSEVTFKPLTEADIEDYILHTNPLDKAGAYGIQDKGADIIAGFKGSLANIMGLPIERLTPRLRALLEPAPDNGR